MVELIITLLFCSFVCQGFRPRPTGPQDCVYRYRPSTGEVEILVEHLVKPNGLCLSPNEDTLYVTDTGAIIEPGRQLCFSVDELIVVAIPCV